MAKANKPSAPQGPKATIFLHMELNRVRAKLEAAENDREAKARKISELELQNADLKSERAEMRRQINEAAKENAGFRRGITFMLDELFERFTLT